MYPRDDYISTLTNRDKGEATSIWQHSYFVNNPSASHPLQYSHTRRNTFVRDTTYLYRSLNNIRKHADTLYTIKKKKRRKKKERKKKRGRQEMLIRNSLTLTKLEMLRLRDSGKISGREHAFSQEKCFRRVCLCTCPIFHHVRAIKYDHVREPGLYSA
jgi:hypothetical protein